MQWSNFIQFYDFQGKPFRRFYKLETLANAIEKQIMERGGIIVSSAQEVLGPTPLASIKFELFQEGAYQLIFRVLVANRKRNRETFGLVVAKNETELSAVTKNEDRNLTLLHARAPRHVVETYRGGTIYLPDRYRRREKEREVYAYVTRWPTRHYELGLRRNQQFFINDKEKHSFTREETERIKQRIVEIVVRTYDAGRRNCMAMPDIASGDFVVTRPKGGSPRVKLIACREILRNVRPARLIHEIVSAKWTSAGKSFYLQPSDPKWFFEAVLNASGKERGRLWLAQYAGAVKSGKFPESERLSLSGLEVAGLG